MKWLLISTCVLLQIIRQVKGDGCSSEALTTGVDVVNWCNTPSIEDPDAADHEKVQYLCGVRKYYIAFLILSFFFSFFSFFLFSLRSIHLRRTAPPSRGTCRWEPCTSHFCLQSGFVSDYVYQKKTNTFHDIFILLFKTVFSYIYSVSIL